MLSVEGKVMRFHDLDLHYVLCTYLCICYKGMVKVLNNPCFTYLRKSCFKNPVLGPENASLDLDAKKFDFIHTLFFFLYSSSIFHGILVH